MSHISANNIDSKLIYVSLSLLSGSQNPNMVNILVGGVCGSHFQNGRHEFPMSHISANNIDRKLIIVASLSCKCCNRLTQVMVRDMVNCN